MNKLKERIVIILGIIIVVSFIMNTIRTAYEFKKEQSSPYGIVLIEDVPFYDGEYAYILERGYTYGGLGSYNARVWVLHNKGRRYFAFERNDSSLYRRDTGPYSITSFTFLNQIYVTITKQ
jgi:hypothetical protein